MLTASQYNTLFTMHGTTMVFLVGMPLPVAFGNYFIPLMIGARDVAFPRLNMFGYWVFLFGGLFIYSGFVLGGAPNGGWFGYTPLTSTPMSQGFLPGHGPDFWTVGLVMLGIGSVTSAINFIVTILNMRAPGMTLMRMPVFVWMMLVTAFLTVFAMPVRHRRADHGVLRPQLRRRTSSTRPTAVIRCCTSICSGCSAIPRCTS